ncbi:putative quinol monooxygenase [Bradyrhizobium sp. WSM2793]|uniref:putative quinol monooxygenase n=1 Tax=Bradyrhizobium sp. WSM2793 TaxID=1038866 RepID=UPI0012F82898|nr:putative quinol monooxygenase [Bradyrhizobium sp. WSM2793]
MGSPVRHLTLARTKPHFYNTTLLGAANISAKVTNNGKPAAMYLLLAEMTARQSATAEVEHILRSLVEMTRDEPDTVTYNAHRHQHDASRFLVYELYKDRGACDAHLSRDPIKGLIARLQPLLVAPPHISCCTTIAVMEI